MQCKHGISIHFLSLLLALEKPSACFTTQAWFKICLAFEWIQYVSV